MSDPVKPRPTGIAAQIAMNEKIVPPQEPRLSGIPHYDQNIFPRVNKGEVPFNLWAALFPVWWIAYKGMWAKWFTWMMPAVVAHLIIVLAGYQLLAFLLFLAVGIAFGFHANLYYYHHCQIADDKGSRFLLGVGGLFLSLGTSLFTLFSVANLAGRFNIPTILPAPTASQAPPPTQPPADASGPPDREKAQELAKSGAITVMGSVLRDPYSANHDVTLLDMKMIDGKIEYLVHDVVRAQNGFGAYNLSGYCLQFSIAGSRVQWNEASIMECERSPISPFVTAWADSYKKLNWESGRTPAVAPQANQDQIVDSVRKIILETKYRSDGLTLAEAIQKMFPLSNSTGLHDGWTAKIEKKSYGARAEATWTSPESTKLEWSGSTTKSDQLVDIVWVPANEQTKKLYTEATGYDFVDSLDEIVVKWAGAEKAFSDLLISATSKAGLPAPKVFQERDYCRAAAKECPKVYLVWSQSGQFTKSYGPAVLPWGDFSISFTPEKIDFSLHDIKERQAFETAVFAVMSYFGKGPWQKVISTSIEAAREKLPEAFGGKCADTKCTGESNISMAQFGYPFHRDFVVTAHSSPGDEVLPGSFYITLTFGAKN